MIDVDQIFHMTLITNLYAKLARAADYGSLAEYGNLLADDVVWEMTADDPQIDLPAQVRRGREDALRGAAERREAGIQGPGTGTWHVIANIAIDAVSDSTAEGTAYWHYYAGVGQDLPRLLSTGVYRDRFVRVEGRWVLAHRQVRRG